MRAGKKAKTSTPSGEAKGSAAKGRASGQTHRQRGSGRQEQGRQESGRQGMDGDVGAVLRSAYQKTVEEAIPPEMLDLLSKLD